TDFGAAIAESLADTNQAIRQAAVEGLAALGGVEQLPALIQVLNSAPDERAAQAAENSLQAIAGRVGAACVDPILARLKDAPATSRAVLLPILGTVGDAKALATIRAAIEHGEDTLQETALRVLSEWPNPDAAPDLLRLATDCGNPNRCLLAFRGYLRLCLLER